jgi:hypothetical protein
VLPQADIEMAEFLHAPMIEQGIDVIVGDGLVKFADKGASIDVSDNGTGILLSRPNRIPTHIISDFVFSV